MQKNLHFSIFFCTFAIKLGQKCGFCKIFDKNLRQNYGGKYMISANRILFVSQEISPFFEEQTPVRLLNRMLPEICQNNRFEARTFMPKFGEINERRHQLHDVIRLSGMNLAIDDTDHPLLIKVASIQGARMQIYFIDNEDLFHRRRGVKDAFGIEYPDNDVRTIFFCRGVLETVEKLRWAPGLIQCSGWMSALIPLYVKKAFGGTPFFADSKVIVTLDDNEYSTPFSSHFARKLVIDGIAGSDVRTVADLPVGYEELMRLAIDYSEAVIINTPKYNARLVNYAENRGKPVYNLAGQDADKYMALYSKLLEQQ